MHVTTLTPAQAALLPGGKITSLRVGGARATRARYPNANPELDLFPKGYVTAKTNWLAPVYPPNNPESKVCKDPVRNSTSCQPQHLAPEPALRGAAPALALRCARCVKLKGEDSMSL